jgi:hypothetical protein
LNIMENLSTAQLAALKAALLSESDPVFVAARQALNWPAMIAFYNSDSSFVVWRSAVTVAEMQSVYVWSEILLLTQQQFNALTLMQSQGVLTPAVGNVRTGMAEILAAAPATLAALSALAKRPALRGERVFATGTGTTNSPGNLVIEGAVTERTLTLALNS